MVAIAKPTILLIIDGTDDEYSRLDTIKALQKNERLSFVQIMLICDSQGAVTSDLAKLGELYPNTSITEVATRADFLELLRTVQTDIIGYMPLGYAPSAAPLNITSVGYNFLAPWPPNVALPKETAKEMPVDAVAWIASTGLAQSVLPQLNESDSWNLLEMAQVLEQDSIPFQWGAIRTSQSDVPLPKSDLPVSLTLDFTVLAIVPHYHCEAWLRRCLSSLVTQTRPPQGIVVVDDGSGSPPVTITEEFPNVTLLASPFNVGPYRLIQQVIDDTNYDAYLFQDADDWSASDRLEKLLSAATDTGAELIGTQEFRVFEEESRLTPVCYPLDVNLALAEKPGHPLLHPSSLVTRDLVQRLGGFATGLKFGGDTEFLLRAALVARIVNVPDYCYFRRKRAGSLTTAPDTGLESPARAELLGSLKQRALANYAALRAGQPPCLEPLVTAKPIILSYIPVGR